MVKLRMAHAWRTQAAWAQRNTPGTRGWLGLVGENNGQLRFIRHHVWRTQARLDQKLARRENLSNQNIKEISNPQVQGKLLCRNPHIWPD